MYLNEQTESRTGVYFSTYNWHFGSPIEAPIRFLKYWNLELEVPPFLLDPIFLVGWQAVIWRSGMTADIRIC